VAQRRNGPSAPARRPGSIVRDEARLLRTVLDATPALLSYWDADERNVFANWRTRTGLGGIPAT
jgi:hypothetical protein